jgi:hypothetical protein
MLIVDIRRKLEQIRSEIEKKRTELIDFLLNEYSKELFGYPPNFEKKIKGKEVDLDKLTELFLRLKD